MKASIKQTKVRGQVRYVVDAHLPGGRKRTFFATKAEAEEELRVLRESIRSGADWAGLPEATRRMLAMLHAQALADGVTLDQVYAQWRSWRPAMGKVKASTLTLKEAILECCDEKRRSGLSELYVDHLSKRLFRFAEGREDTVISSITTEDISDWLKPVKALATRATWINRLSALFTWATLKKGLDRNPCDGVLRVRVATNPVECLSVDDCRRILDWTLEHRPRYLALLVLQLFVGLRPDEAEQMTWAAVNLEESIIKVSAEITKVRSRRTPTLTDAAKAWLERAQQVGSVLPVTAVSARRFQRELRAQLGLKDWPRKLLRKTCASYLMAAWRNSDLVADQLGHSVSVLLKHYRAIAKRTDAERWLALRPPQV